MNLGTAVDPLRSTCGKYLLNQGNFSALVQNQAIARRSLRRSASGFRPRESFPFSLQVVPMPFDRFFNRIGSHGGNMRIVSLARHPSRGLAKSSLTLEQKAN